MALRSIIRFVTKPGREAEFEAAFEAAGMLTRPLAVEGFLGAELLRSNDEPTQYTVIGHWASAEAYARWQRLSIDGTDRERTAALFDTLADAAPGRLFRAVASSTNPDAR